MSVLLCEMYIDWKKFYCQKLCCCSAVPKLDKQAQNCYDSDMKWDYPVSFFILFNSVLNMNIKIK